MLFVFRHAPYGGATAREGLEALLATAVYDQKVAALFLNDGVTQLLSGQVPPAGVKNHERMLSALPLYGVDQIFVDQASLQQRGLATSKLAVKATILAENEVRELFSSFDHMVSF